MPAVSLNQRSGVLPAVSGSERCIFGLSFLSVFALVLQFNFLAFHNVCCPNESFL